ncbi:MAG TPA: hypothetical protein DEP60_06425 [Ruminococcaceae bacterium]|nr:hypothetical protein [Oscillospiraceae bacterium]
MLDEKDLQAIAQLMDSKLKPVNERLDSIDERLDKMQDGIETLKDDSKVTRNAVNNLLDWAEDASIQITPLFKKAK